MEPLREKPKAAKLLFVATVPVMIKTFLFPFSEYFRSKGCRVDGAAREIQECPDCCKAFNHVYPISWSRSPFAVSNFFKSIREVRQIVLDHGYEIVHTHSPVASFLTRFALRDLQREGKVKVIYTAHGFHFHKNGHPAKNALFIAAEKIAGAWCDYLVVINKEDEAAALKHGIVPPERLVYMPGIGVDLQKYDALPLAVLEEKKLREEFQIRPDQVIFTMIAEFNPGKRHADLFRAMQQLNRKDYCVLLAGRGKLMEKMKDLGKDLGILDQLRFLGFRPDVPKLIKLSRAVILPSEREGLPRSILESLSSAVPVLGTDIRGINELLEDGCGVLVNVGDSKAIAEGLGWLIDHPEEARQMGLKGRERAKAYDVQKLLPMHEKLYFGQQKPGSLRGK
ncbi:MAG: glycosyltransferase family 4 protein [Verrucomicrobiales bacterium]